MLKELALFSYGSLAEGMVNFNKISPYIVSKEEVQVLGHMYRLPSGYPVFIQSEEGENQQACKISGFRYVLNAPDLVYIMLDEFHGVSQLAPEKSLFNKINICCESSQGQKFDAQIYAMNKNKLPKNAYYIENGDWVKNIADQPVMTQSLTEKQATYIKKLSLSSGRDIVPIDIALYRELMKLDLIVDKGRRLALSKLGLEVARYLPD